MYDVKTRPENHQSIRDLGIGAQILRPEDIPKQKDTTHKIRHFNPNAPKQEKAVEISRADILITPQSILKHQQEIDSIMISLKPTIYSFFFKKLTKNDLKEFFEKMRVDEKNYQRN